MQRTHSLLPQGCALATLGCHSLKAFPLQPLGFFSLRASPPVSVLSRHERAVDEDVSYSPSDVSPSSVVGLSAGL